ncbi:hypothetical protein FOA43_000814 [Brettanomyces nanus]|uniref:S-adenosylmethionine decarboxylase proenzyme n=1 Tax=Eeniella nana TaxID=13502 RepID=A0A875RY45_EENNA|nr:uncharacterized protein FOA43_000814 [Brettanomyces nanus]QPG73503.1 hypothetical protein FOA43_000814 [Brettanomyces nanus]
MTPSAIFKDDQTFSEYEGSMHDLDFVNHKLSVNLDSTNAFEGPEKLLEIWFSPSSDDLPDGWPRDGLRHIPLSGIECMLDDVNCKILSKISSPDMDAYLLSESSLFVFIHKMILKTCGTTTTLFSLEPILKLVQKYCHYSAADFRDIYRVFYSRRMLMFPDRQNDVHKCWHNEMLWLDKYFPACTADSYIVGNLVTDHWHFYMNCGNHAHSPINSSTELDETLEILMTDIDSHSAGVFEMCQYSGKFPNMNPETEDYGHILGKKMMHLMQLDKIIDAKSVKHDAFAFTPCGFSSNTIIEDKYYCTLHITPERGWSYASFETNYMGGSKQKLINKVIQALKPGKFFLSFVKESKNPNSLNLAIDQIRDISIQGYRRDDRIIYDMKFNYCLLYCYFVKK